MALLEVKDLSVEFGTPENPFRAVDRISYRVDRDEVVGIVGESGCGKSVSSLAIMGLVDFPGRVRAKALDFEGKSLLELSERERRKLTGADIAMIFQDPMTSLDPCFNVATQIDETLRAHARGMSRRARHSRALELLRAVGIPDPEARLDAYPHQLSGGMSQRVMIAIALACNPQLLIADEPTTALDVTIQAQIIDLLLELQRRSHMALVLISHDLPLVAEVARRVVVMYAGQIVESGPVAAVFAAPHHPYTQALIASLPESAVGAGGRLQALAGVVPGAWDRPHGCLFNPRCQYAQARCRSSAPELVTTAARSVRCFRPLDANGAPT